MKQRLLGFVLFLVSAFFFFVVSENRYEAVIFLMGMWYGFVLVFRRGLELFFAQFQNPILVYGALVCIGGMLIEASAYTSNIPKIMSGEQVYLFSTNFVTDMLIGFPHYIALGVTWAWVIKRYDISATVQALLILLFWGLTVDQFTHLFALLSGNILDFVVAGALMVFALNWPLVIMEKKIEETYPLRAKGKKRYIVGFLAQIIPMIVLLGVGFLYFAVFK